MACLTDKGLEGLRDFLRQGGLPPESATADPNDRPTDPEAYDIDSILNCDVWGDGCITAG